MLEWKKIVNNIIAVFFILAISFFFWHFFQSSAQILLRSNLIVYSITIFVFLALFFPTLNIIRNTSHLIKDILSFFVRIYPSEIANEKRIFRNIMFLLFLFVVLILLPGIFLFFQISLIYHIAVGFLMIIFLIYAFRASHLIHSVTKRHERTFDKFSKKYKLLLRNRMKLKNKTSNEPANLQK